MLKTAKRNSPLEEMGIALYIWYTVWLCGHHRLSLSICSVSLFPHTVRPCEAESKELTVSCQQWRHQKWLFGRSWGAWAHRIAAGITQGEMLLLQGWFRTIMEKLCGFFLVQSTLKHTRKAHITYILTSLVLRKCTRQHSICCCLRFPVCRKYCNTHTHLKGDRFVHSEGRGVRLSDGK